MSHLGYHVKIDRHDYIPYTHHGIVSQVDPDTGSPTHIIHYAKGATRFSGEIKQEEWKDFVCNSRPDEVSVVEVPTRYTAEEVVSRAMGKLGRANYHLFGENCESFSHWCHTDIAHSEQVQQHVGGAQKWGMAILGVGAVVLAYAQAVKHMASRPTLVEQQQQQQQQQQQRDEEA